ncbi:hypothetical protein E2C01_056931 [Portunus trituberculatus]|uniref:Uncharacterized protein n=1 Tax=Portunus trituberculatus TaxID=210409 RepID=A0A5B7GVG7_PORTR|nr:hypothetical protein [Portunus trituberculatus]
MNAAPHPHTNSLLSSLSGMARRVLPVSGAETGPEGLGITLSPPELMGLSPVCGGVTTPRDGLELRSFISKARHQPGIEAGIFHLLDDNGSLC